MIWLTVRKKPMENERKKQVVKRVFEAAHRLPNVPEGHKCARIHGHSYQLTIETLAESSEAVDVAVDHVVSLLAHRYLNDLSGLENPTAELISVWVWERLAGDLELVSVRVGENDDSECIYRGA
jgi:6-pyruvoyltetrahydropterin/6-carboxytetrahydropterin synthase